MHFAIDTETTGLRSPWPVEIAAVRVDDFSRAFCERINTPEPIDPRASDVHGIFAADLAHCRSELAVIKDFLVYLAEHSAGQAPVLVAHNARFDRAVLEGALRRCNLELPRGTTWLCTLEMSRARGHAKNTLAACCQRAGVSYEDGHCALPDAIMCARVYRAFYDEQHRVRDAQFAQARAAVAEAEMKEQAEAERDQAVWRASLVHA